MARLSASTVFFPGIVFHELSHYLSCILTGVKVRSVKWFGAGEAFVAHDFPNPWQSLVITASPFVFGSLIGFFLLSSALEIFLKIPLLSLLFGWFAASVLYYSFPSSKDATNFFNSVSAFYHKALFGRKSLASKIFWALTLPFVFLPTAFFSGLMIVFSSVFFLRLVWVLVVFLFAFDPAFLQSIISFGANSFSGLIKLLYQLIS